MALVASFKQQCPSCEAMVSIKENMIGKKVECTKCKDKFIAKKPVEEEEDFEDEDEEEASAKRSQKAGSKKGGAVTAKAPAGKRPKVELDDDEDDGKARSKNKAATNGKANGTARKDADEDDDAPSAKKKGQADGGSKKLVVGLSLAVVGILFLGLAAYFIMGNRPVKTPTVDLGSGGDVVDDPNKDIKPKYKIDLKPAEAVAVGLTDVERAKLSNLLPKTSENVFHIYFDNVFTKGSTLRNAVFETPGALDDADLRKKLGFSVLNIDDMICAEKTSFPGWRYTVIHFKDVVKESELKNALQLESAGKAIEGQAYYKFAKPHAAFDQLARFSFGIPNYYRYLNTANERTTYVRLHNPQTLVVGDKTPMLAFLEAKGQFELQTTRTPAAPGTVPAPMPGTPPPPGGGDVPPSKRGELKLPFDAQPPTFVSTNEQDGQAQPPPGGANGKPTGAWEGTEEGTSKLRFTFDDNGSVIIDSPKTKVSNGTGNWTLDQNKINIMSPSTEPANVVYDVAIDATGKKMTGKAKTDDSTWPVELTPAGGTPGGAPPVITREDMYLTIRPSLKAMLDKVETRASEKDRIFFSSATDMDANVVDPKKSGIRDRVVRLPRQFWDVSMLLFESKSRIRVLGTSLIQREPLKFQLRNELSCGQEIDAKEFQKEMTDRTANQISKFVYQLLKHEVKLAAPVEKKVAPVDPEPQPPGTEPELKKMDETKPPEPTTSQITIAQKGTDVSFVLDLLLDNQILPQVHGIAALGAGLLRVEIETAAYASPRHALADAAKLLGAKGLSSQQVEPGQFPPGAFPAANARLFTDKEPRNRISWMASLLPYLGQKNVYDRLSFNRSWRDSSNWLAGGSVVPQFLDPTYPDYTRQTTVGELPIDFGATHYVGIAGVGLDAASYKRDDPATDHKRGVLSYDGSATIVDVMKGRGIANTILMIQIPYDRGTGVSPWIAGGGATLRGVPEKNSIEPFILGKDRNGKIIQQEIKPGAAAKGTYALMTDGSVRFIGENVSDEVFQAMCTLGGQAPKDFDLQKNPNTPLIPPPDTKNQPSIAPPINNDPPKKPVAPEDPFKAVDKTPTKKEPAKKTEEDNPFKAVDKTPTKKAGPENPFKVLDKEPTKKESDNPFKAVEKKSTSRIELDSPHESRTAVVLLRVRNRFAARDRQLG